MRVSLKCFCMLAALLGTGCIPSLHPAYTESQLAFEEKALGRWIQSNGQTRWELTKRDEQSYDVVFTDKAGQGGRFVGRLVDLGETRLLDLVPEDVRTAPGASGFYKLHLIPIHTVYLLRHLTQAELEIAAVDLQWLDRYLTQNPTAIEFVNVAGRKVIVAPTRDVQRFALEHLEKFTGNIELLRH